MCGMLLAIESVYSQPIDMMQPLFKRQGADIGLWKVRVIIFCLTTVTHWRVTPNPTEHVRTS